MSKYDFENLQLSNDLSNFLKDFMKEKTRTGITLLEYFKVKGILFKPKTIPEESKVKIEQLRANEFNPILVTVLSIVFGLGVIVGAGALIFSFISDDDLGMPLFFLAFIGGISIIYFGLRSALTNVIIFNDRLLFRKPLRRYKVFWHEIQRVNLKEKEKVTKSKNFWGTWKETGRETVGMIMEITLVNNSVKNLDLEAYGVHSGAPLVTRILQYMLFYNPNVIIPNELRKILQHPGMQLPGISKAQQIIKNINLSNQYFSSNPGKALELAFSIIIEDEVNPYGWKLAALLLCLIMPDEAFPFLDVAFSILPNDPDLYNAKGRAYEVLEGYDTASEMYLAALKANPHHTQAFENYKRITGEDPPIAKQTHRQRTQKASKQSSQLTSSINSYVEPEAPKPKNIVVKRGDINEIKKLIGEEKAEISNLVTLSGMPKDKVIKIATKHLGFVENGALLVKDIEESQYRLNIERIQQIIGNKKEVDIEYIEVLTKLPQVEIIVIVENELGFIYKNGKIKQKKKK
ncbi:MAG: tetratricopeptide repeat protein [Candidatus Heimdallarchaeota archaeon]